MKTAIANIHGREVLDSRGNPTVEAVVALEGGAMGTAIVPSGASTGEHEGGRAATATRSATCGKGVLLAVENVNLKIPSAVKGMDAANQKCARRRDDRPRCLAE